MLWRWCVLPWTPRLAGRQSRLRKLTAAQASARAAASVNRFPPFLRAHVVREGLCPAYADKADYRTRFSTPTPFAGRPQLSSGRAEFGRTTALDGVDGGRQFVRLLAQTRIAVIALFGAATVLTAQLEQQMRRASIPSFSALGKSALYCSQRSAKPQIERHCQRSGRFGRTSVLRTSARARSVASVRTGVCVHTSYRRSAPVGASKTAIVESASVLVRASSASRRSSRCSAGSLPECGITFDLRAQGPAGRARLVSLRFGEQREFARGQ